jgi:hypothetical protein
MFLFPLSFSFSFSFFPLQKFTNKHENSTPAAMADELNRDHGGAPGSGVLKASVTDALVQVLGPISAEIERHMSSDFV